MCLQTLIRRFLHKKSLFLIFFEKSAKVSQKPSDTSNVMQITVVLRQIKQAKRKANTGWPLRFISTPIGVPQETFNAPTD